jgi:NAD(P)-dependent dehydrogenase (short-subunit alcohol dehydrogenase family)
MPTAVRWLDCDPSQPRDLRRLGAALEPFEGGLHSLVVLHDRAPRGPLLDAQPEALEQALHHNLHSVLSLAQTARPALVSAGGNVVLLGSIAATWSYPDQGLSGVAHASLQSLVRYMASEWMAEGIRVNGVAAGPVVDESPPGALDPAQTLSLERPDGVPAGYATADKLAAVLVFLAGPEARWITGQTVIADGGVTLGMNFGRYVEP